MGEIDELKETIAKLEKSVSKLQGKVEVFTEWQEQK